MKKSYRLLTLVIAAALLLMTACGNNTTPPAASGDPAVSSEAEQATLVVWGEESQQALYEKAFAEINEKFMTANPNIKIDYQFSGSMDSINVAVQTDSLPDVFFSQGNKLTTMAEMAKNGFLLPLNEYKIDTSRFPKDSIDYSTIDGELYCSLPSFLDYALVYYNADIYEKYSLTKPKTWDEFVKNCETLQANGVTPIAFGGNNWLDRYWFMGAIGPAFFEPAVLEIMKGNRAPDLTGMTEAFGVYSDFAKKGYFGKDFIGGDMAAAQLTFTNGNAAMIVDGSWNNKMYVDSGLKLGRFAMPDKDGKRYAQTGPSQSTTYSVSAKTKYPAAAAKYIEFLSSQETAQIMYNHIGMIPVVDDVKIDDPAIAEMAEIDVIGQNIYGVLANAGTETSLPADLFVNDLLPKLLSGDYTPEKATELLLAEMAK